MVNEDPDTAEDVRLDVWLDIVCLFKTRSEAQTACKAGKVTIKGQSAKPNRRVRLGDEIVIARPFSRTQRIRVLGIAEQHLPKAEARQLYEDLTLPPTKEEIETRRLERIYRAGLSPPRAPDKRQRRALRRLKGRED
jgi:ribosome-associated heat shock protein Hsp15